MRLTAIDSTVSQYGLIEFQVEVDAQYQQPFDPREVELDLLVREPGGAELRVPAFWMQLYERRELTRSGRGAMWYSPSSLLLTAPTWQRDIACKVTREP